MSTIEIYTGYIYIKDVSFLLKFFKIICIILDYDIYI